ncbi:MAG: redoxin domain-containing protein [Chloroflexi bacterium]|nr:redoxin domain-containing protein [Chloroflexota bacterium]
MKGSPKKLLVALFVGIWMSLPSVAFTQGETAVYAGNPQLPAPEFPAGLEWINVAGPLSIADLRGKAVILDFWTYGCINCLHVIPALKAVEAKYGHSLVVIGVHSAKFTNEGESENLRQIVQRYEVEHPVVNDNDFLIWRNWGVRAWPSFAFIDPLGNVLVIQGRDGQPTLTISGELPFAVFDSVVGGMLAHPNVVNLINDEPLRAAAYEGEAVLARPLRFPGKVLADAAGGRLFIADTGHHRIVVVDLAAQEVRHIIGDGRAGLIDGGYEVAAFQQPQGMALRGDVLYVADTQNHAIRAIDLITQQVTTIAGTGQQGLSGRAFGYSTDNPTQEALRSPWDVKFGAGDILYIAMAGTHQIWQLDLATKVLQPAVGNGREAALNAGLADSELAQPSGLYWADGWLYFADSESSTIRVAAIAEDELRVVSGTTANSLFTFGDQDGPLADNLLQHPLGVAGSGSREDPVYIADTYNSRIKVLDPATLVTETIAGQGGRGGYRDGTLAEAEFDEPGGLDYLISADGEQRIYVADTNNHAIRVIDLQRGVVETLQFRNPQMLQQADRLTVIAGDAWRDEVIELPSQTVASGSGTIELSLTFPEDYKINDNAHSSVEWQADEVGVIQLESESQEITSPQTTVQASFLPGKTTVRALLDVYWCEAENASLCYLERVTLAVPVTVQGEASNLVQLEHSLVVPGN